MAKKNEEIYKEIILFKKTILAILWEEWEMTIYLMTSEPIIIDDTSYESYKKIREWWMNGEEEYYILTWN